MDGNAFEMKSLFIEQNIEWENRDKKSNNKTSEKRRNFDIKVQKQPK